MAGVALIGLGWLWLRAWAPLSAVIAAAVCVAGVALRDIDLHFAWQDVAGMALGDMDVHSAWLAWHLYRTGLALLAHLGLVGRRGRRRRLRGRRGTSRHRSSLCVAGMALGDMDVHSAGLAWPLSDWAGSGGALGPRWAPWSPPPFAWQAWHWATWTYNLAGVALGDMDVHSAWQAWHLSILSILIWACSGGVLGPRWAPWRPPPFAWQAWHFATSTVTWQAWHIVALMALIGLGWNWWRAWAPLGAVVATAVCMAGVALRNIDFHFAWQAALGDMDVSCRLALVAHLGPIGRHGRRRRLRGRQGTSTFTLRGKWWHLWHWAGSGGVLGPHLLHTPILHHLFSLSCIAHPIFTFLLLLIGRS